MGLQHTTTFNCECCGGPPINCCLFGTAIPDWLFGTWRMRGCAGASLNLFLYLKLTGVHLTDFGDDCYLDYQVCQNYRCPIHGEFDPPAPCNDDSLWLVRVGCESGVFTMKFIWRTAGGVADFLYFDTASKSPPFVGHWTDHFIDNPDPATRTICCCGPGFDTAAFGDAGCQCTSVTFDVGPVDDPSQLIGMTCPDLGMMAPAPMMAAASPIASVQKQAKAPKGPQVGTALMNLMVRLKIRKSQGCGCDDLRNEMNEAGVEGVVARRDYFVGELRNHAAKYRYADTLKAAKEVVREHGKFTALKLALTKALGIEDEYEWLLRMALETATKGGGA